MAVFRKEKHKIFIKNAGVEADEENEEISSVEYTYAGNRRDDCTRYCYYKRNCKNIILLGIIDEPKNT